METIASYSDFTFFKSPNYTLKFGNQVLVLSEHFGLEESKIKQIISSYDNEISFLKEFMTLPKLVKNKEIILGNIEEATTPETARNGLLGRSSLLKGRGLLIHNCNAIHMYGMQFPINVYFLNREMRVIGKFENVLQKTYTNPVYGAYYALETAVYPYDINLGDTLDLLEFEFSS
jgi:uncharacterized membrane protein (UPF0127 family)